MFVKVCGITRFEDALYAEKLGASAIGFIFYPPSPRYIDQDKAAEISTSLGPFIGRVGVFVNEDPDFILSTVRTAHLTAIQLSGHETPELINRLGDIPVIKALHIDTEFKPSSLTRYNVSAYLLDTGIKGSYGGTGVPFDWEHVRPCLDLGRIILAGGLNPGNIADALHTVTPWGVDVSSGLESSPGIKDKQKMEEFFKKVKRESNSEPNQ